jgi:uncharacterized protein YaaQ
MKLVLAVIQKEDEDALSDALEQENFGATRIGSSGGFLRTSNVTLMVAVEDARLDQVLNLMRQHCKRRTKHLSPMLPSLEARERFLGSVPVEVGGATVFVLELERMEKVG